MSLASGFEFRFIYGQQKMGEIAAAVPGFAAQMTTAGINWPINSSSVGYRHVAPR